MRGGTLPYLSGRTYIDAALRTRGLKRAVDSSPEPCEFAAARMNEMLGEVAEDL